MRDYSAVSGFEPVLTVYNANYIACSCRYFAVHAASRPLLNLCSAEISGNRGCGESGHAENFQ